MQAIAGECGGLQITSQQERPDEAQRQEAKARREGDWVNGARMNAAEVIFTCQGPSEPVEGRAIASTMRLERPGVGATWSGSLRGYLAPPHRAEVAYQIMEHTAKTQQTNPQWKARQRQTQQAQMQASQQTHQQRMAQLQNSFNAHQQRMAGQCAAFDARNQAWQANQAAQDRTHDQFIGSIRDETRVWDTNTGQAYDVPTDSDGYYIDNSGSTIVGTPGYVENPDPTTYDPMYEGYDYDGAP